MTTGVKRLVEVAVCVAALWGVLPAQAQVAGAPGGAAAPYPTRPVRLIVGFPPGGGNDVIARLIAARLQDAWSQPVIVDNRPGADGVIATEQAAKASADGYTLLIGAAGQMTALPALHRSLPYDTLRDFAPVGLIASFPLVLTVHPDVKAGTPAELVALAKASPGKLNYGAGASAFQLAMEQFKQLAGIDVRHIAYKGGAQTVTALLAGDVQITLVDSTPVLPHLHTGRLRALAVTSARRSQALPGVPTMMESGFPGYEVVLWTGLFARSGTPDSVVQQLQRDLGVALRSTDVRDRFAALGLDAGSASGAQFAALVKSELTRWAEVARIAHLQTE